jgi:nitric oxide reductase large subunit
MNDAQLQAFKTLLSHYEQEVLNRETRSREEHRRTQEDRCFHRLVGGTASAQRPGKPHSYTKNLPPEKLVGNALTEEAVVWSSLSIIVLLAGIGLVLGL